MPNDLIVSEDGHRRTDRDNGAFRTPATLRSSDHGVAELELSPLFRGIPAVRW